VTVTPVQFTVIFPCGALYNPVTGMFIDRIGFHGSLVSYGYGYGYGYG
jgi:hypothetical protein